MKNRKQFLDIVIFGGSLSELNKKYPDREYEIAGNFFTNSRNHFPPYVVEETMNELGGKGYDGIIRTNLCKTSFGFGAYFTGLPIKRIK